MLDLKHLFDWSYDDLEHEVRANLVFLTNEREVNRGRLRQIAGMAALLDELGQGHDIEIISLHKKTSDQIRAAIKTLNIRTLDLILTDNPRAVAAVGIHRADLPRMQIVLWIRDPAAFDYLAGPTKLWKGRREFMKRLGRDRAARRLVDQVVLSPEVRLNALARLVLRLRDRKRLGTDQSRGWREVIEAVQLWAPYRLI